MINAGGLKPILKTAFFGFLTFFIWFSTHPASAQEVPQLTGSSTEDLLGPGMMIEAGDFGVERSRYGSYERAMVKAVDRISQPTQNGAEQKNNYTLTILTGDFKDQTFTVRNSPNDKIQPGEGDLVMVFIQPGGSEEPKIFLETYDRKNLYLISLILLSIILLALFGLRGLAMGAITFLVLWLGVYTALPLYLRGWPILIITALTVSLLSAIISFFQFGWQRKVITTTIATLASTLVTALIIQITANSMHLTPELNIMAQNFFKDQPMIDPAGFVILGLILACFAIIQDTASSISCGLAEFKKIEPKTAWKELFTKGMNIGRAHTATMIIVLTLTWMGSSMFIFINRYQLHNSWLHFLNQDPVSAVLILIIAGIMGIALSVPITAAINASAWTRITPSNPETNQNTPSWRMNASQFKNENTKE